MQVEHARPPVPQLAFVVPNWQVPVASQHPLQLVSSHFRYNADGHLTGMISPQGTISQLLYGREMYERRFPPGNDYRADVESRLHNLSSGRRLLFWTRMEHTSV